MIKNLKFLLIYLKLRFPEILFWLHVFKYLSKDFLLFALKSFYFYVMLPIQRIKVIFLYLIFHIIELHYEDP